MFHKVLINLVVVTITFICLYSSLHSQETILLLEDGEASFQSGDYNKSLTYWLKALQINPNSTKALLGHAKTSIKLNSIVDAESSYSKALRLSPDNTEAIAGIGIVLSINGDNIESRKYLESNLHKYPHDNHLLLALSSVYEDMDKLDLAIYKLEAAKKIRNLDPPLLDKLGYLYIRQNKLNQALNLSKELESIDTSSMLGYRLIGIVNSILAYRQSPSSSESERYYQSAKNAFNSTLISNPNDKESLYWLGKLNVWRGEESRLAGLEIFQNLNKQYPKNEKYILLSASLLSERNNLTSNEKKVLEEYFQSLIKNNDLDEITRFQAEEFAIRFLPRESQFRKNLGLYRLERFQSERNNLHLQSSLYHVFRAKELIPNQPATLESLIDVYKYTGNIKEYIQLLSLITRDDPGNFKARNKLEQSILHTKKTLEYQEGYFYPNSEGILFRETTTLPKIHLMDFIPIEELGDKILSPTILKLALIHALKYNPGIHLASDIESNQIQTIIRKQRITSFNPYHDSTFFDINQTPGYPESVRFIGFGKFKDYSNSIQIEFQIYDRKTGKFSAPLKLHSKGRSSLAFIGTNISQKIKDFIPKEGNIIKIKREGVIINLGLRNGITKDSYIEFIRDNKKFMNGRIYQLGDTISLVKPDNQYWERELATGDRLIALEQK